MEILPQNYAIVIHTTDGENDLTTDITREFVEILWPAAQEQDDDQRIQLRALQRMLKLGKPFQLADDLCLNCGHARWSHHGHRGVSTAACTKGRHQPRPTDEHGNLLFGAELPVIWGCDCRDFVEHELDEIQWRDLARAQGEVLAEIEAQDGGTS